VRDLRSGGSLFEIIEVDGEGTANALGLAGTQSSGLWAFTADGSMSKRLHSGRAAQSGLYLRFLAKNASPGQR